MSCHGHVNTDPLLPSEPGPVRSETFSVLRHAQVFPQPRRPDDGPLPLETGAAEGGHREALNAEKIKNEWKIPFHTYLIPPFEWK